MLLADHHGPPDVRLVALREECRRNEEQARQIIERREAEIRDLKAKMTDE